jgi:RimJ/RimL family protein N-acetyltransferase
MLKGEKVTLRAVERDDLKRLHELNRNVELVVLADDAWRPVPFASYEKGFDKHLDDEDKSWFVIEVDGVVIGEIGLHGKDRRAGSTEFGIGIYDPDYVGKGHGPDAIRVLLRWAFHSQNWRRVWLETIVPNERAIKAYRAWGFREEGRLREQAFVNGEYVDVVLMGLLRSEWEAQVGNRQ